MLRTVCPEILDTLPASHPDAQASRRDLVRINQLMGNGRWFAKTLRHLKPDAAPHYLEIGAGDGSLARRLIQSFAPAHYTAIDLAPQPADWPSMGQWKQSDLLQFTSEPPATHLIANLVLHHFKAPELSALGQRIQDSKIQTILACEPCRRNLHTFQLRAGKWIGFNRVTLHDGCVSVEAGFRGNELPEALGLASDRWDWSIQETFMGAYRMIAERK